MSYTSKRASFSDLKASARRMGLNVIKVQHVFGDTSINITRIGNASRLYECGTVASAFGCLNREQDKRAKAQVELERLAQERSDLTDICLVS